MQEKLKIVDQHKYMSLVTRENGDAAVLIDLPLLAAIGRDARNTLRYQLIAGIAVLGNVIQWWFSR